MKKINNKYLLFPLFLILLIPILGILNFHGSSIANYNHRLNLNYIDNNIIFGSPRSIRSDEYLVGTPIIMSQDINNEPNTSNNLGVKTKLTTSYNIPTRNFFSLFKPATWIFFLSNNLSFNFSVFWWTRIVLMLIGLYLLLLELTRKNLLLSITGSLLFLFSPFIQWWLSVDPMAVIAFISFGLFFFIKILKSKSYKNSIPYSLGLAYSAISFILILYPPFQIPVVWVAIFLALGIFLLNRKKLSKDKKGKIRILTSLLICVLVVISIILSFYIYSSDVISTMMNTTYPGERFFSPGLGSFFHLLSGFYNLLMQRDSNGPLYSNQSESSNFLLLYIPLLFWILYINMKRLFSKKSLDYIALFLVFSLMFLSIWYIFPLPDFFSRYTGLSMVLPQRIFLGIGYANYILLFYLLSKDIYKPNKKDLRDLIFVIVLIIITSIIHFLVGKYFYESNPQSFWSPTFLTPVVKIALVSLFVPLLLFILIMGYKKIFVCLILLYGIISSIFVNPLYRGIGILRDTNLAKFIQETSENNDLWIIYDDIYLAQYALANNSNILNGVHLYPQFEMWEKIDPGKEYFNIYNRYAHVAMKDYEEGEELIVLTAMDAIQLNIDPCDNRLKDFQIKFLMSKSEFNKKCLVLLVHFEESDVYIYEFN